MSNSSVWLAKSLLNHYFRHTPTLSPDELFLHLYISDPTTDDVGTEIQGGDYAPQPIAFTSPANIGGNIQISNAAEIRFPVAQTNWGGISHFAVRTAAGDMLIFAAVPTPKIIEIGDEAKFIAGSINIRVIGNSVVVSGGDITTD